MHADDKRQIEKVNAQNAVEELYIYEMKDKRIQGIYNWTG